MSSDPIWPQEYSKKILIGDIQSNIGIATLWSTKEPVGIHLDSSMYCVIANFYDKYNAIEPMIRNCLSNPYIRYIIVLGSDLSGSLNVLRSFFYEGVESIYDDSESKKENETNIESQTDKENETNKEPQPDK
ncbi:hypothetical protein CDIK_2592 [Cucumispora dikerogammari]|nr:hypothetical protein CDIK_2592 [Cucumispora dikerogammari]